jgi:hypothetical protein
MPASDGPAREDSDGSPLARVVPGDYLWLLDYKPRAGVQPGPLETLLGRLRESKVPTAAKAEGIAWDAKRRAAGGIDAQEHARVVGLVRSAVTIPGYASRGDLIWIVRIFFGPREVLQEAWVSSSTGAVRWIFPLEKPGSKQTP